MPALAHDLDLARWAVEPAPDVDAPALPGRPLPSATCADTGRGGDGPYAGERGVELGLGVGSASPAAPPGAPGRRPSPEDAAVALLRRRLPASSREVT